MKQLYLVLLLLMLSMPLSSAQQALGQKEPLVAGAIVLVLQRMELELANGQTERLAATWASAENEWQKLFANVAEPRFNKIYNQLQISYLVFQEHQDIQTFRQDLALVLARLTSQPLPEQDEAEM